MLYQGGDFDSLVMQALDFDACTVERSNMVYGLHTLDSGTAHFVWLFGVLFVGWPLSLSLVQLIFLLRLVDLYHG